MEVQVGKCRWIFRDRGAHLLASYDPMERRPWLTLSALSAASIGLTLLFVARPSHPPPLEPHANAASSASDDRSDPEGAAGGSDEGAEEPSDDAFVFRLPSGEPTMLTCLEARTIVAQARAGLAYEPGPVSPAAFAASTADWLDPHGLLSVAKEAPTTAAIVKVASALLADVEGRQKRDCASALVPGATLDAWTNELRDAFDEGRKAFVGERVESATADPLPPNGNPKDVAFEIGRRVGLFESLHPDQGTVYGDEARRRFFPSIGKEGWARVVLASAVRAYVPLVDPHGEWAPFDEESRIYELALTSRPPSRLWGRAVPTAIGIRLNEGAAPPLEVDDVVLEIAGVKTAGLPVEQIEQLGLTQIDVPDANSATNANAGASTNAGPDAGGKSSPVSAVVLRRGTVQTIELVPHEEEPEPVVDDGSLPFERIPYGNGDVLLVAIKDVRDDLGDELADLLAEERHRGPRELAGIVLDLRDNGGGSTDGAIGALSLFLPGQPLFAMKRRDGGIEVDRATVPRDRDVWTGPVATFVDGTTASAAEMIAGALAAYRRGPSVGTNTFGKGCAQEYVDDDAHAGVLRLTTLIYALPDGSPVQRVGLTPQIRFPFPGAEDATPDDREAKILHAAPTWRGPDLRRFTSKIDGASWPATGNVGPCQEQDVCRALRLLGNPKRAAIAKH